MLLVSLAPVLGRKHSVPLMSSGRPVAVGERPSAFAWNNGLCSVCIGRTNGFSLWEDFFHFPLFIYPFADGERFLCIYDYDTAVLVFVLDFAQSASAALAPEWPSDAYVRGVLMGGATNVVMKTRCLVRLPVHAELLEVSSNLTSLSARELRAASFPTLDAGVYRGYWPKEALLSALATNRQSCWP